MNVISCNFPLISHSSSFCVNLSTIIMKVESVTTVVGFFNAFFGLLFCGKVAPGSYTNLFFVEGLAVSSSKCLPVQSGYPISDDAFNYYEYGHLYPYSVSATFMARTDLNSAQVFGCGGWYWWVGASFAVGITIR